MVINIEMFKRIYRQYIIYNDVNYCPKNQIHLLKKYIDNAVFYCSREKVI